jgi:hypothetical protein
MKAENQGIYASPRIVTDITHCYFYPTIDLPGIGIIEGNRNLRARWFTAMFIISHKR